MEEEEARKIHQRMMSELENIDLNNELFIVNSRYFFNILNLLITYYLFFIIQDTKETENVKEGADPNDITEMMSIKKDLSSMSEREKQKLLLREAPEIFGLITDFKSSLLTKMLL